MLHYAFQMGTALSEEGADVTLITGRHFELAKVAAPFRVDARLRLWPAVEEGRRLPAPLRKVRRAWRGLRFVVEWRRLGSHLLRERPDVVQFATIRFGFQTLMLRRLRRHGLRLAQVCHEYEPREARLGLLRRLNLRLAAAAYRTFEIMFFHGRAHLERFEELFDTPARKVLIPHGDEGLLSRLADPGGNLRERYTIAADRPVIVFFGGLRPSKGLPDLAEAFAAVRRHTDAALVIAGHPAGGFDVTAFRRQLDELGIGGDTTIDGRYLPIEDIGPLVRTATVVALPYRSGTASGVLQAAYAFDRPVVVTDVGSLAEAVDDGETGFVVPAGDPAALAAALLKVVSDPDEAAAMGNRAGRVARERFGWGPIARTVLDTYGRRS
jgi:glycosyltransferase involved in cell wall biosynthesis